MNEQHETDADFAELLRAAERMRLRALVAADVPTADRLHADDYQLITPGGVAMSKAAYAVRSHATRIRSETRQVLPG